MPIKELKYHYLKPLRPSTPVTCRVETLKILQKPAVVSKTIGSSKGL